MHSPSRSLDAEYADYVRPYTYFALLDPALTRWIFCQYSLALGVAQWKRVRTLHLDEAARYRHANWAHHASNITETDSFISGSQWLVCSANSTPNIILKHLSGNTRLLSMNTFVAGVYRMYAFRCGDKSAAFYWFDYRGVPVARQIVPDCFKIEYVSPANMIIMDYDSYHYEMKMVLPTHSSSGGCAIM